MAETADTNQTSGGGAAGKKGPIDVFLSLFADVKPGEGLTALLLLLNVLLLLVAYYVLKTVREPLIIASGGAQLKAYATAAQAVLLIGFVPAYAALTKRFQRMQLITATLIFYAAAFVVFWLLAQLEVPYLGFAFFLFLGIFSLSVIAQFWSLANDLYNAEQGKRLFAILGIGGSVGAVVGSYVAKNLVGPLGPFPMMLVAAGILLCCLGLSWLANTREAGNKASVSKTNDKPVGGKNGFALILSEKYLVLIAGLILVLNLVNTTGELILDINLENYAREQLAPEMTQEQFQTALEQNQPVLDKDGKQQKDNKGELITYSTKTEKIVGEWRGDFFTWVNLIGAIAQLFLVSRIFKYLGLRLALFSLPLIGMFAYGVMAFFPVLALVRIGKIAENSCDYSLYNTAKQALWLPTTREQKYNAKMAIDTFIVRAGDLVSGGFVALGIGLGFTGKTFALVNLGVIVVWLAFVVAVGRENARRTEAAAKAAA